MTVDSATPSRLIDPARFLVKVCGITTVEDAFMAVEQGANALGFNFYPRSKRYLSPEAAAQIVKQVPPGILNFGIVVLGEPFPEIPIEFGRFLQGVQVHRVAGPEQVPRFPGRVLVAVEPGEIGDFPNSEVIVDSSWGSGKQADWDALRSVRRRYILSGGLTPANVAEAIWFLDPAGVDVCSGVESSPGRKDPAALSRFLEEVYRALDRNEPVQGRGGE